MQFKNNIRNCLKWTETLIVFIHFLSGIETHEPISSTPKKKKTTNSKLIVTLKLFSN